jgi:hypothetical protein
LNTEPNQATYTGRDRLELIHWPEFFEPFLQKELVIFGPGALDAALKLKVFTVCSLSGGCRHCQAHGAFGLHRMLDVPVDEITALWTFERSDYFDEATKAALKFGRDAGIFPNAVGPEHFEELRRHYNDQQIRELLAVVSEAAFLNRFNDTAAVVTEADAADWATENLTKVGWEIGRHAGPANEQRQFKPGDKDLLEKSKALAAKAT